MSRKKTKVYIGLILVIAFLGTQLVLPIQIASAQEKKDPTKECGMNAAVDFAAGMVSDLVEIGLSKAGEALNTIIPGAGELFGGDKPVKDTKTRSNTRVINLNNCIRAVEDSLFRAALANLKKRLLDRITDDTIEWINNGAKGKPRFVDNFRSVFAESANEALGDTAREIGLGKLCDEKLSLKLQLNLKKPATKRFRTEASCTLNKIVDNINDFKNDFRNGGWVGYTETLVPSNNRFGLELLAYDNLFVTQTQKEKETQTEVISNNGFKGVKACSYWGITFQEGDNKFQEIEDVNNFKGSDFNLVRDPNTKFTQEQLKSLFGHLAPQAVPISAVCTDTQDTMPGTLVEGQAKNALESDKDVLANSDDLSDYISAIFDAAISRIVKNGLEGIGIKQGGSSGGSSILTRSGKGLDPEKLNDQNDPNGTYRKYGEQYKGAADITSSLRDDVVKNVNELKSEIDQLEAKLPGYIVSMENVNSSIEYLRTCEAARSNNTTTVPAIGMVRIPCTSTDAKKKSIEDLIASTKEFQSFIGSIKEVLAKIPNNPNDLGKEQLIALGSQISDSLQKVKITHENLKRSIDEVMKTDKKVQEYKESCMKATTPGSYICPETF